MQYTALRMPMPSEAAPIERTVARRVVFECLRGWIEEGVLTPGEVIKDREIAATLGVSRTPVREALQLLEEHGAVEMRPGQVTRVADANPEDIALVYPVLAALQALAAELGTSRATQADVEEMNTDNHRLLEAIDAKDPPTARDADRAFHGVLVRLADNPYLVTAIEPLLLHIRRLEARFFADEKPGHESHRQHKNIIAAVSSGQATRARELTHQNFLRYWGRPDLP